MAKWDSVITMSQTSKLLLIGLLLLALVAICGYLAANMIKNAEDQVINLDENIQPDAGR